MLRGERTRSALLDAVRFLGVAGAIVVGVALPLDAAAHVCPTPAEQETMALINYTWAGGEPAGTYTFFVAALIPGALADGRADPGDILAVSTTSLAFTP